MKTTAALALCAMTLTVAGCTLTDETPPGGSSALAEEEASDEDEGIPAEGEGEAPADEAESTGEAGGGESGQAGSQDTGQQTGGPEATQSASDLPDPESMDDEVCVAFFEGAAPLAAVVQDGRSLVSQGARTNLSEVEFMQVEVLAERLDELSSEAPEGQGAVVTSINIPFTEVGRAAEEGGTDEETGEVSYEPIEMTESEEAQQEFTSDCTSSTE
ncbi:MAG: hypothetical protein WA892_08865 [Ornithinimicrobium sp.]